MNRYNALIERLNNELTKEMQGISGEFVDIYGLGDLFWC